MVKFRFFISLVVGCGVTWANAIAPGGSPPDALERFEELFVQTNAEYWSVLRVGQNWLVPGGPSSFPSNDQASPPNAGSFTDSVGGWPAVELWDRGTREPTPNAPGATAYLGLNSYTGQP